MAIRYESYRTRRLDNLGDPEWHNRRWQDIDLRMHARELDAGKIDNTVDRLEAVALSRLNDTFSPLIQQAMNQLADVGVSFSGQSLTTELVSLGPKTFIIVPQHRVGLVVVDYVSIRPTGVQDAAMICNVLSYDRASGALEVEPVEGYVTGSGSYHDWTIRVSVTPNLDTYSREEIDGELDALRDSIVDEAPIGLDTIGKIATLLGGGAGGGAAVMMKANNLSDVISIASARANLGLGNVNNTSDATKPVSAPQRVAIDAVLAGAIPSGTQMIFSQPVVPTGWIRNTAHNDKGIRIVSSTGGGVGGVHPFSTVFSRINVDSHTLDGNELTYHAHGVADPGHAHGVADPTHTHGQCQGQAGYWTTNPQYSIDAGSYLPIGYDQWGISGAYTGIGIHAAGVGIGIYAAGANWGHTHGMDNRVQYVDVLIGIKS